jgi:hypothetical protein
MLPKDQEERAKAFVDQAFEFFEAARNPRTGSRPLLYYYSFLNLAKVLLLVQKLPLSIAPQHGVRDPRANIKRRLQFSGQKVRFELASTQHDQLFPEFVSALGGQPRRRELSVVSLLRQIPGMHRTFCRVTNERPSFLPVRKFSVLSAENQVFARMLLDRIDADVQETLDTVRSRRAFQRVFQQVQAERSLELCFETAGVPAATKRRNRALRQLAERIRSVGVWSILTRDGYRFYLGTHRPSEMLPPLGAVYAVMFYLGSITRYKPYDFDKIVSRQFAWLISEFLRTQPNQFVYCLASHIAGVDVVPPFASLDQ